MILLAQSLVNYIEETEDHLAFPLRNNKHHMFHLSPECHRSSLQETRPCHHSNPLGDGALGT